MKLQTDMPSLSRRDVMRGAAATAIVVATGAIINPVEAWGLEVTSLKPQTMRTLVQMARDIYPHDRVPDRFYVIALKEHETKSAEDAELKALIEEGAAALDNAAEAQHGVAYAEIGWEADRVALLREMEDGPFFAKIRSGLVTGLYNQKEVWPLFGYEGESVIHGGYIERGFDDIEWL